MGSRSIEHRLDRGILIALHRGIYAVGHDRLSTRARWMASVLCGGAGALLGIRSAAALWALRTHSGATDVLVRHARAARAGIAFHRADVPDDERAFLDGIPVTTVTRTLFDLAAVLPRHQLVRAVNEAEVQRLTDPLSLPDLLARYSARQGTPALRAVLSSLPPGGTVLRSDMEALFHVFLDDRNFPRPAFNKSVEGLEVDCVWWRERVTVELDSRGFHDHAIAYERDRERDRILNAADWRPLRITWRQLNDTPDEVERDLRRVLRAAVLAKSGASRHN